MKSVCKMSKEPTTWPCSCRHCPLFFDCLLEYEQAAKKPETNLEHLRSMDKASAVEFLCELAYGGHTPWSEPFAKLFCRTCPTIMAQIEGKDELLQLHECDFSDGKCPHGSDVEWWLDQPWKENVNE